MILVKTFALVLFIILPFCAAGAGEMPDREDGGPACIFDEEATRISRLEPGETFYGVSLKVSHDNAHVAYAARNAQGMFAVMDHHRSRPFSAVARGTPLFSSGQLHWAYIAHDGSNKTRTFVDGRPEPVFDGVDCFTFSPDGTRWAYRAGIGKKQTVVVEGRAGPVFDAVIKTSGPSFSPDGNRLAYGAMNGRQGFLITDDQMEAVNGVVDKIVFSPDAQRIAYTLKRSGRAQVVCDGRAGAVYNAVSDLTFSPDSKRLVYMADKGTGWVAVADGKEQEGGDGVGTPLFSPDSRHLAYVVTAGGKWRMVFDGARGRSYERIGVYMFSSDSRRLAYMAELKEGGCIVVNETAGAVYDGVGMPVFSPDGAQIAYRAAAADGKWFIVQNGRPHAHRFDAVRRPVFSPDGRRLAYIGISGNQEVMILDEHPLGRYDKVSFPCFSPGGNSVAYTASQEKAWRIFVNGRPGEHVFDSFLQEGVVFFSSETRIHALGLKLPPIEFWRLDVTLKGRNTDSACTGDFGNGAGL